MMFSLPQTRDVIAHSFRVCVSKYQHAYETLSARGGSFSPRTRTGVPEIRCFFRGPLRQLFEISEMRDG